MEAHALARAVARTDRHARVQSAVLRNGRERREYIQKGLCARDGPRQCPSHSGTAARRLYIFQ